jgi:hypothetical protein
MTDLQFSKFATPKAAPDEYGQDRLVSFAFERVLIRWLQEAVSFFTCKPVSEADAEFLWALHASYPGDQFWTE